MDFLLRLTIVAAQCLLLAGGTAQAAATPARDTAIPPAVIASMRCSTMRGVLVDYFLAQLPAPWQSQRIRYSREEVRAMLTGVDNVVAQFCAVVTPMMADTQRVDLDAWASEDARKAMLADPKAVDWMRVNSLFLVEIEPLNMLYDLGNKLYPDRSNDKSFEQTREVENAYDTAPLLTFTEEESKSRRLLVAPEKRPWLAAMLPARYDLDRLVALEVSTRRAGAPFLDEYADLPFIDTETMTVLREPTPAEAEAFQAAQRTAMAGLAALTKNVGVPKE